MLRLVAVNHGGNVAGLRYLRVHSLRFVGMNKRMIVLCATRRNQKQLFGINVTLTETGIYMGNEFDYCSSVFTSGCDHRMHWCCHGTNLLIGVSCLLSPSSNTALNLIFFSIGQICR